MDIDPTCYGKPAKPFGRRLLDQQHRADPIGRLAQVARSDPRFPRDGDVRAISAHLNSLGADGDMHLALEEAELDYQSC